MQFNFFSWMREGVKQAILLGVSDAVEEIGLPPDGDEIGKRLQRALKQEPGAKSALPGPSAEGAKRKRLGRSLRELDGGQEAPAAERADKADKAA
jgi:hypothetical protein